MGLLTFGAQDNVEDVAREIVKHLKNVRQATVQADTTDNSSLVRLYYAMVRAKAFVTAAQVTYGSNALGNHIASMFGFTWADEVANFGALLNTVMPNAITAIKALEADLLNGTLGTESIDYVALSAGQQTTVQGHIDNLAVYLV